MHSCAYVASALVSLLTVVILHIGRDRRWHHLEDVPWVFAAALMWWLSSAIAALLVLAILRSAGRRRPSGKRVLLSTTIVVSSVLIVSDLLDRWIQAESLWI